METKSLKEISLNITEEEYRQDPALSYSTLSRFQKTGFNNLDSLFDRIESPSLTFGSAVDSIITGGEEEFSERFFVADFPQLPDTLVTIVKALFDTFNKTNRTIESIDDQDVITIALLYNYQNNWKPETRAKVIKEKGSSYYKLLYLSQGKTLLSNDTYLEVLKAVDALQTSLSTRFFFNRTNPFDSIEKLYQLKFKATLDGIDYKCMADELIVDHITKTIYPIDLKTSSKPEWDFYKSFIEWNYQIQARLYWRIIRANLDKDPYFKDFKLEDYQFVVVNKKTLTPLVWKFEFTTSVGELTIGEHKLEDPEVLGKELHHYLTNNPPVPDGINVDGINSLTNWLQK